MPNLIGFNHAKTQFAVNAEFTINKNNILEIFLKIFFEKEFKN